MNTPGPTDRQRQRTDIKNLWGIHTSLRKSHREVVLQTVTVNDTGRFLLECMSIHLSVRDRDLIVGRYVVF